MSKTLTINHSVWCLFSRENNYDQLDNHLVCWWLEKPSIETLAKFIVHKFPADQDKDTVAVVKIWNGEEDRISNTDYRLVKVREGHPVPPADKD